MIYFWLCWVFDAARAFLQQAGATLHCNAWASHCSGFSLQSMDSTVHWLQQLWPVGS